MTPTPAQIRYLFRAAEIQQWQDYDTGIFFSLWVPGHTSTGRVCLKRGWIHSSTYHGWPFHLTKEGWKIAFETWERKREQTRAVPA